jgi:peptidoglycan/LPS O-acetylase OafA/YrhL
MLNLVQRALYTSFRPLDFTSSATRHNELDGLRGWAALSVLLLHQFHRFYEYFFPLPAMLSNPVVSFLCDGHFAVYVFFIISGEALSSGFFARRDESIIARLAVKRYFRLVIPIMFASIFCFAVARSRMMSIDPIYSIIHKDSWVTRFVSVPHNILFYIKYIFWNVFVWHDVNDIRLIISYLWTMHYEFVGSFILFFALFFYRHIRRYWVVMGAFGFALCLPKETGVFSCFVFGSWCAFLRAQGIFARLQMRFTAAATGVVVLVALAEGYANAKGLFWDRKEIFAIPLVFGIWSSRTLCLFLTNGLSRLLGVLSFPVYLVQYPVMLTYTSWIVLQAAQANILTPIVVPLLGVSSIIMSYGAAALFVPVEVLTRWVGDRVAHILLRPANG